MELLGIGVDLMSVVITFVILVGVLLGRQNAMNQYFPNLLTAHALTILSDLGIMAFEEDPSHVLLLKVCFIAAIGFAMAELCYFCLYIDNVLSRKQGKKKLFRAVPVVIAAITMILCIWSLFDGFFFTIDNQGVITRGTFFWFSYAGGVIIAFMALIRVMLAQVSDKVDNRFAISIYLITLLPLIALYTVQLAENNSILFGAFTVSYMIMFISIHVKGEQVVMEKEVVEEQMSTELVLSQIQPHFIFNSLTTIKYLCGNNPHLAIEAVTKFTRYLRTNLDTIEQPEPVLFREELDHTKTYLWLEQLRFGKNLNVEYSIDVDQFYIPALSLQPIVENAVKHGVTKKIGGGTITIAVRETETYYLVRVEDDGVGFDKRVVNPDTDPHIGIDTVRKRLSALNGSTIKVTSQVGIGTKVEYRIMKENANQGSDIENAAENNKSKLIKQDAVKVVDPDETRPVMGPDREDEEDEETDLSVEEQYEALKERRRAAREKEVVSRAEQRALAREAQMLKPGIKESASETAPLVYNAADKKKFQWTKE